MSSPKNFIGRINSNESLLGNKKSVNYLWVALANFSSNFMSYMKSHYFQKEKKVQIYFKFSWLCIRFAVFYPNFGLNQNRTELNQKTFGLFFSVYS